MNLNSKNFGENCGILAPEVVKFGAGEKHVTKITWGTVTPLTLIGYLWVNFR